LNAKKPISVRKSRENKIKEFPQEKRMKEVYKNNKDDGRKERAGSRIISHLSAEFVEDEDDDDEYPSDPEAE